MIRAGSYPNGHRCSLSSVCAMMGTWTSPYIPFSKLIQRSIYLIIHKVVLIHEVLRDQTECNLGVIMLRHRVVEVNLLTSITMYLAPGFNMMLF